jgi:penicillin-binding protein 1A
VELLSHKGRAGKIARTGARTFGGIVTLIFKIIGTLLLIGVTTGVIFSCIFTIYVKTNLTSELDISLNQYKMNLSSVVYYKDKNSGDYKELVTLQSTEFRKWISYDQIPKYAEYALVAIEDKRFYDHHGVDWYRTIGAFGNMFLSMKDNFGGSTITQQLIKRSPGTTRSPSSASCWKSSGPCSLKRNTEKTRLSNGTSTSSPSAATRTASARPRIITSARTPGI